MEIRAEQDVKQCSPSIVTLAGRVTVCKTEQSQKAYASTLVR
jgi:hypothetical protein